ncbi:hypothetical protein MNBD_ALPHA12-2018 [hydrothermal vent metagenome]|uniref:Uncharacterized protein n=1 Tax=hydrothermal vent metagenome TaxID=652676 RepID=A0A3B0T934_9ZZZZ
MPHLWSTDHGVDHALPADMKKPVKSAKDYSLWYKLVRAALLCAVSFNHVGRYQVVTK